MIRTEASSLLCLVFSRLRVMDNCLCLQFFHLSERKSGNSQLNADLLLDASEDVKCVVGPKMSSWSWQGWPGWEGSGAGRYEDNAWRS